MNSKRTLAILQVRDLFLGNRRSRNNQNAVFNAQESISFHLSHHLTIATHYHSPVLEMAHSSNVIVHGTLNSVQGDYHIHNEDSEFGMHDFRSEEHPYQ